MKDYRKIDGAWHMVRRCYDINDNHTYISRKETYETYCGKGIKPDQPHSLGMFQIPEADGVCAECHKLWERGMR